MFYNIPPKVGSDNIGSDFVLYKTSDSASERNDKPDSGREVRIIILQ